MVKIKSQVLTLLLVFFFFLIGCVTNAQQAPSVEVSPKMTTTIQSKQELARAVLSEAKIAEQYDVYLGNVTDMAFAPEMAKDTKFSAWMQALLVREAGWKYIEAKYVAKLEASFSETELRKLLDLAKQPLMKKLLQTEIEAYSDAGEERRRLLSRLLDNYNSGRFAPPP